MARVLVAHPSCTPACVCLSCCLQDNGYGTAVLGPVVVFAAAGPQTIRIQTREDGFRIDQVVLSAEQYLNTAPGALKNDTTILR